MAVTVTTPTTIIVKDSAARGPVGPAPTFAIGNVTTGAENSSASITNVGNSANIVLDISIPRGNTGNTGPTGPANPQAYDQANLAYGQANSAYTAANNAANTVRVSQNSGSTLSAKQLNFVNTANVTVTVTDSGDGNANIAIFSAGGGAGLPLANGTSNVDIALANGYVTVTANAFTWTFNETNGLLELAGNLANFSACSAINFVANSSGDGAGYSTIELRPDSNATNDQYLIIDPTVPNHIHIRAGGTQDNSNGQIFLGGEYSYFSVGSGLNPSVYITANQRSWSFNNDGTITFPDSTTQTTAYTGTDIITTKKVFETINALSSATGVVNHNCNNGHIFVHSSVSANFTANFTNTTIAPNTATSFTLVINQGATPYVANAVQIGGVAQTVNWQGSTSAPGGNANKKDVISFSVVNNNGTWIMLGQLTSFG